MDFNKFLLEKIPEIRKLLTTRNNLSYHDCEEVISDCLFTIWERISSGKLDSSNVSFSYLMQQISWKTVDKIRKDKTRNQNKVQIGEFNDLDSLPEQDKQPPDNRLDIIKNALKNLRNEKRPQFKRDCKIFSITVFENKTAEQAAQILNTSKGTVYLARHRVGKIIKQALKDKKWNSNSPF